MSFNGIDVSVHNGVLDWKKIKESDIQFAIIRTGYGMESPQQKDGKFEENYAGARSAGILLGTYHYSYADSVQKAEKEAEFVLKLISGKFFEYPIFFDIEDEVQQSLSKELCSNMVNAFCSKLERSGYWAGVYSYDSFFSSKLDESIQKRFSVWVSSVENVKPVGCKRYDIWQNSWQGRISGSSEKTDTDISYKNFFDCIKREKRNGF